MKLEIKLPDDTLKTAGGREVCDLLNQMTKVVQDWALATKSPVSIVSDEELFNWAHRKDFCRTV